MEISTKLPTLSLILVLWCWWPLSLTTAEETLILKTCTLDNPLPCPEFAECLNSNGNKSDYLKCICMQGFNLNPNWQIYETLDNNETLIALEHYCLPTNHIIPKNTEEGNKLIVYLRSPARKEHLLFSILLVLLAAFLATAVLYGLKLLRPLKRSKTVYKKLKLKRRNITPLQDFDELELNRHYEMQMLQVNNKY